MTNDALTHERCSELLGDFARGRLDVAEAARVEAHLAACPDCSAELRAVIALQVDDEPLTELERARIHKQLDQLIAGTASRSPRGLGRLAAALGAAALLAVAGVAVVSLGTGGSDESDSGAAITAQDGADQGERADDSGAGRAGAAVPNAEAANPRPGPSFDDDAGRLTAQKLDKLARRDRTLTSFSNAYSAEDATLLKDEYVAALADQAGPPVDDLIRACAEEVYASQPYAVLPAYAARGRLQGREALILGFVWTDEQSGPLNQFMFWTWPESSCEQPIDYRTGQIGPRK